VADTSLEWMFSIDAKIDGLTKMMVGIEESQKGLHNLDHATSKTTHEIEHVSHASEHAAHAHGKHGHAIWQLGHQYEYAKNGIHEFAEAIGLVLAYEAVEKLVDKVKELGEEMLEAGAKAERTDKSFKALLGEEAGGEVIEEVESLTKHTEFATERVIDLTAGLLRVGFAEDGLRRARAAAMDLAALPGGNLEEAAAALERIKRTGRVDNRTLGGIGFGENDFLAQMEKRTGKGRAILKKELEAGKVDSEEALEALYDLIFRRTGKALGAVGVEMSRTMGARLVHLKEVPEEIFKTIAKTDAFEKMSKMIGDLAEDVGPKGRIGSMLAENLNEVFGSVVDKLGNIDWASGATALVDTLKQALHILEAMVDTFASFARGYNKARDAVRGVFGLDSGDVHMLKEVNEEYRNSPAGRARAERIRKRQEQRDNAAFGSGITTPVMQDVGHGVGTHGAEAEAKKAGARIGHGLVEGARSKEGIDAHSPSRKFEELGRMSAIGYVRGLDSAASSMDRATAQAVAPDSVRPGTFARPAGEGGLQIVVSSGAIQVVTHIAGGVAPGDADQMGEQVAARVEAILPGALQSVFEKMAIQAGQGRAT
jgi:hypothetical protein